MSAPRFEAATEALAPPLAGDPYDDDGQVIDDLFNPTSGPPPDMTPALSQIVKLLTVSVAPTRVISGFQNVDSTFSEPTLICAKDLNRKRIVVRFVGGAATDFVYVTDEKNKAQPVSTTSGQAGKLLSGADITLDGHNGNVWVGFGAGSGSVSWWAVTE